MNIEIPQSVKACLWSYNIDKIDLSLPEHKEKVIKNVLNRGTNEAVLWLRKTFSENEISEVIKKSSSSSWSKKSLALWSLIFNTFPTKKERFA